MELSEYLEHDEWISRLSNAWLHDLQQSYINQGSVGQCHNRYRHEWNKPESPEIGSNRDIVLPFTPGHNYGERNLFPKITPAKRVEEASEPQLKAHTV